MFTNEEIKESAGSYLSDELEQKEVDIIDKLLIKEKSVQEDLEFWKQTKQIIKDNPYPNPWAENELTDRLSVSLKSDSIKFSFSKAIGYSGWLVAASLLVIILLTKESAVETNNDLLQRVAALEEKAGVQLAGNNKQQNGVSLISNTKEIDINPKEYLGISVSPTIKSDGLIITEIKEDSPILKTDIKEGDIIFSVGNCPVHSKHCIKNALKKSKTKKLPVLWYDTKAEEKKESSVDFRRYK